MEEDSLSTDSDVDSSLMQQQECSSAHSDIDSDLNDSTLIQLQGYSCTSDESDFVESKQASST